MIVIDEMNLTWDQLREATKALHTLGTWNRIDVNYDSRDGNTVFVIRGWENKELVNEMQKKGYVNFLLRKYSISLIYVRDNHEN